jgi:hypothetical protein
LDENAPLNIQNDSQDSSVNIVMDGRGLILGREDFSLVHSIQTRYGTQPASYPLGTIDSFPRGKAVRA